MPTRAYGFRLGMGTLMLVCTPHRLLAIDATGTLLPSAPGIRFCTFAIFGAVVCTVHSTQWYAIVTAVVCTVYCA